MKPKAPQLGLKSEPLRAALQKALAGRDDELVRLLCHHGGLPAPRPNLDLAAAFGAEIAAQPGDVTRLLVRLGAEDAAPDTAQAFLPVAAAHAWAACLRQGRGTRETRQAWAALEELAADERAPVRLGTLEALAVLASKQGLADRLLSEATDWLGGDDLARRLGASALVVEALGDGRFLSALGDPDAVFAYLSLVVELVATAPRAAERLDARRRLLASFPKTLAAVAGNWRGGEKGRQWLADVCADARQPDLRDALAAAIVKLRTSSHGQGDAVADGLRKALDGSAKPPRDPTRIRPGKGRGKASRGAVRPPRIREN